MIVKSIHGTEYFVLVIFDGINLSTASTKPVLNLTHMSYSNSKGMARTHSSGDRLSSTKEDKDELEKYFLWISMALTFVNNLTFQ